MEEWSTQTHGAAAQKEVAAHLEGRTVAVDISLWVCHAKLHATLSEVFDNEEASTLKVAFDRVGHHATYASL